MRCRVTADHTRRTLGETECGDQGVGISTPFVGHDAPFDVLIVKRIENFRHLIEQACFYAQVVLVMTQKTFGKRSIRRVAGHEPESGMQHSANATGSMGPEYLHGQGLETLFEAQHIGHATEIERGVGKRSVEVEQDCFRPRV